MKFFLILPIISLSIFIQSNHHEEVNKSSMNHENNFAYLSTYTMPAGSNPATLAKSLMKNVEDLKKEVGGAVAQSIAQFFFEA